MEFKVNNNDIIVEILESSYYKKACDLINKVFKNEGSYIDVDSINGKINDNCQILCARKEENIVGIIVMSIISKPFQDYKYLYLDYVCTDPECRKMGIGKKMLLECEKFAKENNCKYITFTSNYSREDAHRFYLANDYKIVETAVFKKEI